MVLLLLTGRSYEAEICVILLLLRCTFRWYPFFFAKVNFFNILLRLHHAGLLLPQRRGGADRAAATGEEEGGGGGGSQEDHRPAHH